MHTCTPVQAQLLGVPESSHCQEHHRPCGRVQKLWPTFTKTNTKSSDLEILEGGGPCPALEPPAGGAAGPRALWVLGRYFGSENNKHPLTGGADLCWPAGMHSGPWRLESGRVGPLGHALG